MAFSKDLSRKFVNTFIAINSPEKLDPSDRDLLVQERSKSTKFNGLKSLLLGSAMSMGFFKKPIHRAISLPLLSFSFLSYFNAKSD